MHLVIYSSSKKIHFIATTYENIFHKICEKKVFQSLIMTGFCISSSWDCFIC